MGIGCSRDSNAVESESEMMALIMPVYYDPTPIDHRDIALATRTWDDIFHDRPQRFQLAKQDPNFNHPSCLSWFYISFYDRKCDLKNVSQALITLLRPI